MPKDTKSLDNNKAPACESRGFVHKKEGVHFDTPSLLSFRPRKRGVVFRSALNMTQKTFYRSKPRSINRPTVSPFSSGAYSVFNRLKGE